MRRPGIANLLLVAGSLAVGLLGAELCLRFASPQIFDIHPRGMYVTDDAVGYVFTPGFSGILSAPSSITTSQSTRLAREVPTRDLGKRIPSGWFVLEIRSRGALV